MTEVLYILARSYVTDLPSCNAGKLAAQCGHAGSAFTFTHYAKPYQESGGQPHYTVMNWHAQSKQGFGTKLVLAVTEKQMRTVVGLATKLGYKADVITDDTYPYIVTNEVAGLIPQGCNAPRHPISDTHQALYRSEDTVGYVFVPNKEEDEVAAALLGNFKLHP